MKNVFFCLLAGGLLLTKPSFAQSDTRIKSVMDSLMTELYKQNSFPELSELDEAAVLQKLTPNDQQVLATAYWQFEVSDPVIVSVMKDIKQKSVPFWLVKSGFRNSGLQVKNTHYTYEVWQKEFAAGLVSLGINGFDKHRPVYFVAVAPQQKFKPLKITPVYPKDQYIGVLEPGAFTYHDWSGLTLTEVPDQLMGQQLMTTIRGRAREAHSVNGAFRWTATPFSRLRQGE